MSSGDERPSDDSVWLHAYQLDACTAFLNHAFLDQHELGIYHCGVEVFGFEWAFQYYEDTWNDPAISGLTRCLPKSKCGYEYLESFHLGPTSLTEAEVKQELLRLYFEWPACSYHIINNNCLVFAEHFSRLLKVPKPFPMRFKGILEASAPDTFLGTVVDHSWSLNKWAMCKKHGLPQAVPCSNTDTKYQNKSSWDDMFCCVRRSDDSFLSDRGTERVSRRVAPPRSSALCRVRLRGFNEIIATRGGVRCWRW